MDLKKYIVDVKDFPRKGVIFKDITPLLKSPEAFSNVIDQMAEFAKSVKANVIVAPEARGFIFGSPVAYKNGQEFVLVRKPGKLPKTVDQVEYTLEYGTNVLELQVEDLKPGDRVVIIDDILATGGTIEAIIKLIEDRKAVVAGICFLADITELNTQDLAQKYQVKSLIKY
jgi:adenine phosphoribosyltransferase